MILLSLIAYMALLHVGPSTSAFTSSLLLLGPSSSRARSLRPLSFSKQQVTAAAAANEHKRANSNSSCNAVLALSLSKPLGLILEELQEGKSAGVFVLDFGDAGSALQYANQLQGATLSAVQGQDTTTTDFDSVMDKIVNAPDPVDLEFLIPTTRNDDQNNKDNDDDDDAAAPSSSLLDVGTEVTIRVLQQDNKDDYLTITARVGDNLRKVLQENGFEVYQGMKQKLGNCGGAGQCTFCAMDFIIEDDNDSAWAERSEYEDQKLAKFPKARLACLNSIQGPATIRKTQR